MRLSTLIAAGAGLGLLSSSAMAAVYPSTAQIAAYHPVLPVAGARLGATSGAKRSDVLGGTGLVLVVAGVAAAGVGVAAAAGAFDNNHHSTSP